MRKGIHILFIALLIGSMTMLAGGCKKKQDTTVEIFVRNSIGSPVPGAFVRLFGESTLDNQEVGEVILDDQRVTDGDGRAFFDYTGYHNAGQAGFAVLTVEITKPLPPPDEALFLRTVIEIIEETNNVETYVLE
jgi:hypothetical protein